MNAVVRTLSAVDAPAYRDLRLTALTSSPEAFGAAFEDETRRTDADWRAMLSVPEQRTFFGAFLGDQLVGMANWTRARGAKQAHKGWLFGMYVDRAARSAGIGTALVDAVLRAAREASAIQVLTSVTAHNDATKRLYERAGFSAYGTEPRALRVNGAFVDEIHMVKHLDDR